MRQTARQISLIHIYRRGLQHISAIYYKHLQGALAYKGQFVIADLQKILCTQFVHIGYVCMSVCLSLSLCCKPVLKLDLDSVMKAHSYYLQQITFPINAEPVTFSSHGI